MAQCQPKVATAPYNALLAQLVELLRADPGDSTAAAFLLERCDQGEIDGETAQCLFRDAMRRVYFGE